MHTKLGALIVVLCLSGCSSSDDETSAPVDAGDNAGSVQGEVPAGDGADTGEIPVESDPGMASTPGESSIPGSDPDPTDMPVQPATDPDPTGMPAVPDMGPEPADAPMAPGTAIPADDEAATGTDPLPEAGDEPAPLTNTALITLDNHVALLQNVFAVYSGKLYGDDILTAPDYSDPAYDGVPDSDGQDLVSVPVDITCSNGGTASFVPETTGFFSDNVLTWNFDFDNCQDGSNLLDGQLRRSIYEELVLTSSGFTNDMQTRIQRFSGQIFRSHFGSSTGDRTRFWDSTGVDYSLTGSTVNFTLADSTTSLATSSSRGELSGSFQVTADWTDGQPVSVRTVSPLTLDRDAGLADNTIQFESGQLEVRAGADNSLLLDAGTGDIDTVSVTVTANGSSSTVIEPWAPWIPSLIFDTASGF